MVNIPVIGAVIELAAKLVKGKKPHQLWYQGKDGVYRKKGRVMSSRQCRLEAKDLAQNCGYEIKRFRIYRDGIDPNKSPLE